MVDGNDDSVVVVPRSFEGVACCGEVTLADFMPTTSIRQKTFQKMVLALAEVDYEVYNVPFDSSSPRDESVHSSLAANAEFDGEGISENAVEGHDFVFCES